MNQRAIWEEWFSFGDSIQCKQSRCVNISPVLPCSLSSFGRQEFLTTVDNGLRLCAHTYTRATHARRCASADTEAAYRPADNRESLPTRHCIAEQNYTYIVSHVNERSALTLLSSLRIVLRSRRGPPARPLYPHCDLRISYSNTPTFLPFFSPLFFLLVFFNG